MKLVTLDNKEYFFCVGCIWSGIWKWSEKLSIKITIKPLKISWVQNVINIIQKHMFIKMRGKREENLESLQMIIENRKCGGRKQISLIKFLWVFFFFSCFKLLFIMIYIIFTFLSISPLILISLSVFIVLSRKHPTCSNFKYCLSKSHCFCNLLPYLQWYSHLSWQCIHGMGYCGLNIEFWYLQG